MKLRRWTVVGLSGDPFNPDRRPTIRRFFFRFSADRVADNMTISARSGGLWAGEWYDTEHV